MRDSPNLSPNMHSHLMVVIGKRDLALEILSPLLELHHTRPVGLKEFKTSDVNQPNLVITI